METTEETQRLRLPYALHEDADATRAWVMEKWAIDDEARDIWTFEGGEWLTYMSFSLIIEFSAHIDYVLTDMWHAVGVEVYTPDGKQLVNVACDRVEDGLFAIWRHLYEVKAASQTPQ